MSLGKSSFGYLAQFEKMMNLKINCKTNLLFLIQLTLTSLYTNSPVNQELPGIKFNERRNKCHSYKYLPDHVTPSFHVAWRKVLVIISYFKNCYQYLLPQMHFRILFYRKESKRKKKKKQNQLFLIISSEPQSCSLHECLRDNT